MDLVCFVISGQCVHDQIDTKAERQFPLAPPARHNRCQGWAEVAEVADPVAVGIGSVVVDVVVGQRSEVVGTHGAVVATVAVSVGADVGVQRIEVRPVGDPVVVVVGVVAVGGAVAVGVGVGNAASADSRRMSKCRMR